MNCGGVGPGCGGKPRRTLSGIKGAGLRLPDAMLYYLNSYYSYFSSTHITLPTSRKPLNTCRWPALAHNHWPGCYSISKHQDFLHGSLTHMELNQRLISITGSRHINGLASSQLLLYVYQTSKFHPPISYQIILTSDLDKYYDPIRKFRKLYLIELKV